MVTINGTNMYEENLYCKDCFYYMYGECSCAEYICIKEILNGYEE